MLDRQMQTFQFMAQQQQQQFISMMEFMNKKITELILKVVLCVQKCVYVYVYHILHSTF